MSGRRGWRQFDDRGAWFHVGATAVVQPSSAGGYLWSTPADEGMADTVEQAQADAERAARRDAVAVLASLGFGVVLMQAQEVQA